MGWAMIVDRGYKPAANLHDQVRRAQPLSHYFYVMTHGYGAMPDYSAQITPVDRWAVAAYIRALQLSRCSHAAGCAVGRDSQELGRNSRGTQFAGERCETMGAALNRCASLSAGKQRRNSGDGSGQPGGSEDCNSIQ